MSSTAAARPSSAADIEEHLHAHPAISSAAAVPLKDPYLGEKICAAVVFTGIPMSLTELNEYLDQRGVATHARPDVLTAMRLCRPLRSARSTRKPSRGSCSPDGQ